MNVHDDEHFVCRRHSSFAFDDCTFILRQWYLCKVADTRFRIIFINSHHWMTIKKERKTAKADELKKGM